MPWPNYELHMTLCLPCTQRVNNALVLMFVSSNSFKLILSQLATTQTQVPRFSAQIRKKKCVCVCVWGGGGC